MSKRFVLSMGHRNTNRGGAVGEFDWTPGATRALRDAIVRRGGQAWIIQEEAGGSDPNFFNGGLQAAAGACVTLAGKHGPFAAYISMHYDSTPGFHAIFPDSPTGGVDVKANNPLDVTLCRNIRDAVRDTRTVPMKSWTRDSPGVMSERETHVGSQGFRLGEFYGTLGFRATTARVILEASGHGDPYLKDKAWVGTTYPEAVVNGLEATFGTFRIDTPAPQPEPRPEFPPPMPIPELAGLPAYLKLANGAQLIRVAYTVKAVRDTPRLRWATKDSPRIGPDVQAGQTFEVSYLIVNADGSLYWYTPFATRIRFDDAVPYFADVDD